MRYWLKNTIFEIQEISGKALTPLVIKNINTVIIIMNIYYSLFTVISRINQISLHTHLKIFKVTKLYTGPPLLFNTNKNVFGSFRASLVVRLLILFNKTIFVCLCNPNIKLTTVKSSIFQLFKYLLWNTSKLYE